MNSHVSTPLDADGTFTVDVFDSFETTTVTREEWDQFVLDVGGDIYVTYDWCRIWWRHYGKGRQLRIFVFRTGNSLVGLAPMFLERLPVSFMRLKIAKRVGADFALTLFGLPFAAKHSEIAYRELIRSVLQECCDVVWLGPMPENDPTAAQISEACQNLSDIGVVVRDVSSGPHTLFLLPDNFKKHIASLDSRQRQNYQRRWKLLSKDFKVRQEVVKDAASLAEAFSVFKSLHKEQWRSERLLGHFGDWPKAAQFNDDLIADLSRLGRVRIVNLYADDRLIVSQYAFVFGDCCYWRLPGRAVEKDMDRFGLGVLGLMQLIEIMIGEGVRRIEAGVGHYEYKLRFGGQEKQVRSVLVARRGAVLRARIFLTLSDLLHLVYYRIWRLRVASFLRLTKYALWELWIRTRV